jgi:hypothetical protein
VADALTPNNREQWSEYLYDNGFIDINGNPTDKEFVAGYVDDWVRSFFKDNPEAAKVEEEEIITETREWLIDVGVDPSTIDRMDYESLLEVVDYAGTQGLNIYEDLGISTNELYKPMYEDMTAEQLYDFSGEMAQSRLDKITDTQLEQLANNILTQNPYNWFDGIDGVSVLDYGALIEKAVPYFQEIVQDEYGAWGATGWSGSWGSNPHTKFAGHVFWDNAYSDNQNIYSEYHQSESIRNLLTRAANNSVAIQTGLMHPTGDTAHSIGFKYNDSIGQPGANKPLYVMDFANGGNSTMQGYLGTTSNNMGLVQDENGNVAAANQNNLRSSSGSSVPSQTIRHGGNPPQVKSNTNVSQAYQNATGGRYSDMSRAQTLTEANQAYDRAKQNLKDMRDRGDIDNAQATQALDKLNRDARNVIDELLEDEYKYNELTEEKIKELEEYYGVDYAEQRSQSDLNDDGLINNYDLDTYYAREEYNNDLRTFGDANEDGEPDYPRNPDGTLAHNPDYRLDIDGYVPYGSKLENVRDEEGNLVFDENGVVNRVVDKYQVDAATGRMLRPGDDFEDP